MIFGATREEERVHVVDVGEERGGLAGGVGRYEGFAVGGGVAPGGAQLGVGVEGGAEVRGFGDGGVRGTSALCVAASADAFAAVGLLFAFASPNALSTAGPRRARHRTPRSG